MGGEVSKVNTKGMASSTRIPTNFRHRLHDMRKRRRFSRPTKQSTPFKKELLRRVIDEDEKLQGSLEKREYIINNMKKVEADDDQERVAKLIEAIVQEEEEEEQGDHGDVEDEDDDSKDDQRMIKRTHVEEGDDICPGSPSFRVYFTKSNVEDKKINEVIIGNKDVVKDTTQIAATNRPTTPIAATLPSTKVVPVGKKVKKEKKRKSFRSVLPKNLLNVVSCRSAAHSSPDRTHLLPGKAPT